MRDPEPFLERLQGLGVEDLEDLTYLQESDLLSVLRPIEARKLLSLLQKTRNSTLAAENFMLSVDQTIVNGHIRIFSDAVMLMFGSYYCMNISYPAAQASTLEFLQRCLFKINPDKGSKVDRNATKKKLAVNPKVLTLITRIADYEWRE
ncbi:unnamed protein product [Arctogadus glacialis]